MCILNSNGILNGKNVANKHIQAQITQTKVNKDLQYKFATKIQAWVRGFQCRKNLIQQREPALAPEPEGLKSTQLSTQLCTNMPKVWKTVFGIDPLNEETVALNAVWKRDTDKITYPKIWFESESCKRFKLSFILMEGSENALTFNDNTTGKAVVFKFKVQNTDEESVLIVVSQHEIKNGATGAQTKAIGFKYSKNPSSQYLVNTKAEISDEKFTFKLFEQTFNFEGINNMKNIVLEVENVDNKPSSESVFTPALILYSLKGSFMESDAKLTVWGGDQSEFANECFEIE